MTPYNKAGIQAEICNYYARMNWKKWTYYCKCSQKKYCAPAYLQNGQPIKMQKEKTSAVSWLLF